MKGWGFWCIGEERDGGREGGKKCSMLIVCFVVELV